MLPREVLGRFEVRETRNAAAVLSASDAEALAEITGVLRYFRLSEGDVLGAGGEKSELGRG